LDHDPSTETTGLIKINDHCLFTWCETIATRQRRIELRPEHCAACIDELKKLLKQPFTFSSAK
jgi:hypothetical protein